MTTTTTLSPDCGYADDKSADDAGHLGYVTEAVA